MGEIVEFPHHRESRRTGCARWTRGQAGITLSARPACAALAMALAAAAPAWSNDRDATGRQGARPSATTLTDTQRLTS